MNNYHNTFHQVEKIYPDHANYLRKSGLAPSNFLTMGDLCSKQDEKVDIETEPDVNKKKKNSTAVLPTNVIFLRLSTG